MLNRSHFHQEVCVTNKSELNKTILMVTHMNTRREQKTGQIKTYLEAHNRKHGDRQDLLTKTGQDDDAQWRSNVLGMWRISKQVILTVEFKIKMDQMSMNEALQYCAVYFQ